jgi:hypothetical protein
MTDLDIIGAVVLLAISAVSLVISILQFLRFVVIAIQN